MAAWTAICATEPCFFSDEPNALSRYAYTPNSYLLLMLSAFLWWFFLPALPHLPLHLHRISFREKHSYEAHGPASPPVSLQLSCPQCPKQPHSWKSYDRLRGEPSQRAGFDKSSTAGIIPRLPQINKKQHHKLGSHAIVIFLLHAFAFIAFNK